MYLQLMELDNVERVSILYNSRRRLHHCVSATSKKASQCCLLLSIARPKGRKLMSEWIRRGTDAKISSA